MKVRLLKNAAFHDAGTVLDVPPPAAEKMIRQKRAEYLVPPRSATKRMVPATAARGERMTKRERIGADIQSAGILER